MQKPAALTAFCLGAVVCWTAGADPGRTRVIHGWPDEVTVDGRRLRGRIEIVFDYGAGRARELSYDAEGRELKSRLLPVGFQPAPCAAEIAEARDAVSGNRELRGLLRRTGGGLEDGVLLQQADGPCGPGSRCLQVQMTTADRTGTIRFVVYNLASRSFVSRDYTPVRQGPPAVIAHALSLLAAAGASCAAPERLLTWPSATNPAWSFCVLTPRDSSGASGSGLEIRHAYYNGHPLLRRAHAPVVSADYEAGCGCARGWSYEEAPFEVVGFGRPAAGAPGSYAEAAVPPRTACEAGGSDPPGTFQGVAAERLADRIILTTQMSAGAQRYTMSWAFRLDGTIEPRFAFAAAPTSCSSHDHFHHVYWRFDFDVDGDAPSPDREEMRRGGAVGKPPAGVMNPSTRRGYVLLPGPEALTLPPDPSWVGDVWLLKPKPDEITDAGSLCAIDFGGMLDEEPLGTSKRVIWYHGSAYHRGGRFEECERVGPTLQPVGDWSRPGGP